MEAKVLDLGATGGWVVLVDDLQLQADFPARGDLVGLQQRGTCAAAPQTSSTLSVSAYRKVCQAQPTALCNKRSLTMLPLVMLPPMLQPAGLIAALPAMRMSQGRWTALYCRTLKLCALTRPFL